MVGGRYRLSQRLAGGRATERWEATDTILARRVIVERLAGAKAADADAVAAFRRTAVALARLSHPGLVAVYDTGSDDGGPYAVSEVPRGTAARDLLARGGPQPAARAVAVGSRLADTLEAAHLAGVHHGDLGPHCVFIADDDHVKVDGWVDAAAAHPAHVPGDEDLAAAGALVYELLCGRRPATPPALPRHLRAGIPPGVEAAVMAAVDGTERDPARWRASLIATDVVDDARPEVERQPTPEIGVRPVPRERRRLWLGPAGAAALIVAAVVAVVVVLTGGTGRHGALPGTPGSAGSPVAVATVTAFDPPPGDGVEDNSRLPLLIDGNPATVWSTETYTNRHFGNLKPGVGVVLGLASSHTLRTLVVDSPTPGWTAQVYVATSPASTVAGWGRPVATFTMSGTTTTASLNGARGAAVLVWITDLGPNGARADIGELHVQA